MSKTRRYFLFIAVAAGAVAAGYALNAWQLERSGAAAAEAVMASRLNDLQGRPQSLDQWRGKVLVVNFWATWCAPCREEIPAFVRLQDRYRGQGLQFVGIAIDQRDKVEAFAREFGMNYPVLLGGIGTVDLSRRAGNSIGALPYTLVLDRAGHIVGRELGGLKEARLEALIQPLL